jgi:hypothetical protein
MTFRMTATVAIGCLLAGSLPAYSDDISAAELRALLAIARAASLTSLSEAVKGAPAGYRIELVAAYRSFRLQAGSRAAAENLLRLLPADGAQHQVAITLADSLCDSESFSEMRILEAVQDRLPREWASAVVVAPQYMLAYLKFSTLAITNPHSDYAVQMRRPCQRSHKEFMSALNQLSEGDRQSVVQHVIDPASCQPLRWPESDR